MWIFKKFEIVFEVSDFIFKYRDLSQYAIYI